MNGRSLFLLLLSIAPPAWGANPTSIAACIASWTTIAVNSETMAQTIRHPKATGQKVSLKVKALVSRTHKVKRLPVPHGGIPPLKRSDP